MTDRLLRGQILTSGNELIANSGHYRLVMQSDGNLVIYDRDFAPRWATNTDGNGPSTLYHQGDSNITIRRNGDGVVTYSSDTFTGGVNNPSGLVSDRLVIQDDGNFALYAANGTAIWATGTASAVNLPALQIISELQSVNPSSIIELFELQLNPEQHGSNDVFRFHAGTSLNNNGSLYWAGNEYLAFPIEAEGFEYSGNGQLPRPRLRASNVLSTITALMQTLPDGLEGAKVTRIRTLARYIDSDNFPAAENNPFGTPDPSAEFPREIYYIDRKTVETRDVVEFELAAAFDLAGVRAPKRQCIANICQWRYRSAECGYTGGLPTCNKTLDDCRAHFGQSAELPYGAFPGIGAFVV
jgi:lambda family phage minor tail protein L